MQTAVFVVTHPAPATAATGFLIVVFAAFFLCVLFCDGFSDTACIAVYACGEVVKITFFLFLI